ncbi:CMP-sialic acid transporter 1 [Camellia lanceoleosa]|uniref:CMP-sialic acid transporter 1 n=1 Tax=Camellia lanceoleosa TaxID=1840588 RepID=A0ACC0IWD2_9ERIC|nr:CMP-sialic acid transporter 1 [Camellia lanceoleosa]
MRGFHLNDLGMVSGIENLGNGFENLAFSGLLLWRECQNSSPRRMTTEWKSVHLYPIPSIIYLIHNNVQFATLTYVDTSTYQIMHNLKIVTTGILFRLFLQRKLSYLQWMAIVLLAIGTTTSQLIFSFILEGYLEAPPSHGLSGIKQEDDWFGVIFNMARLILDDFTGGFENRPWWQCLLNGYSTTTWLVVLNLGSTGLLVSWLMKYADNIVKHPFSFINVTEVEGLKRKLNGKLGAKFTALDGGRYG